MNEAKCTLVHLDLQTDTFENVRLEGREPQKLRRSSTKFDADNAGSSFEFVFATFDKNFGRRIR